MFLFLFSLLACAPTEREGTIVGNPSQTRPSLAEIYTKDSNEYNKTSYDIPDFTYTGTEGVLVSVELFDGDGQLHTESYEQSMSLLGESVFELPPGQWTAMTVHFEDIAISGYFFEDNPHLILMDALSVELYGTEFNTDDSEINLEVGDAGWLNSYNNWPSSDDIIVSDVENSQAFESVGRQSALFQDLDGDRLISVDERENALLAAGPDRNLEDVDFVEPTEQGIDISADSGCQSVRSQNRLPQTWFLTLGLSCLMVCRRRSQSV